MKIVFRILWAVLFVVFFVFAVKNTQEVALRFFLDYEIRGPLVLLLLGFFVGGGALGVLAMTPTVFRHRRELAKHRKMMAAMQKESDALQLAKAQPPQPDFVANK